MYRNNNNISIKSLFLGIMLCLFVAACDNREKGSEVSLAFSDTVEDRQYLQNTAITPFMLPAASGGDLPLSYTADPLPDGITFDSGTRELSGTPTAAGTTMVTYTVTDADGDTAMLTFNITVAEDTEPSFGARTIEDQQYLQNSAITPLRLPAASGGNGTLTYSLTPNSPAPALPSGLSFNSSTRQLSGTPSAAGTTMVTYTVTDADGDTATLTFSIEVAQDLMPSFGGPVGTQTYLQNTAITTLILPAASGGNGDITYSLTPNSPATALPSGLTFNSSTRQLSGTPTTAGTTMVTYTATDQDGDEATLTFSIEVATDLMPGFGGTVTDQQYLQNSQITPLMLPAASGGDLPLSYTAAPLPDGITFDSVTRELRGTPTAAGTTMVTYTVTDADGDGATLTFSIEVEQDLMPSFGGPVATQTYIQNSAIPALILPRASGGDGDITYSLTANSPATMLPAGLSFDSSTRQLTGTPTTAGTTMVTYTATDQDGDPVSIVFSIEVAQDLMPTFGGPIGDKQYILNRAITAETLPEAISGNGTLTYSLNPPNPAGLTFTPGTRELSGTPTTAGTTRVTYTATDQDGDPISIVFSIEVVTDLMPSFGETIEDQVYIMGVDIGTVTLPEATDGDMPIEYSLSMLPDGMTFNSVTRELSGTPAAATDSPVDMTYTATDADMDEETLTFTITVEADTMPSFEVDAGSIGQVYDQGTEISPTEFPEAVGGNAPLTYTITPEIAGLTLDPNTRILTGTPTTAGNNTYTYTVTDANGDTAELTPFFVRVFAMGDRPSFGGQTVESQTYIQGIDRDPMILPEATGRDVPLVYSLSMLPDGMTFNTASRELGGQPTAAGTTDMIYTVTDADDQSTTLIFTITSRAPQDKSICDRTDEVESAIIAEISGTPACEAVSELALAGITILDLASQDLDSLQAGDFDDLVGLTDLHLQDNALTTLPENVFEGLTSLEILNIDANALTTIPENLFNGLSNIEELGLNANALTTLPDDVFNGLSTLGTLGLGFNRLTSIPEDIFDGLSGLTDLAIGGNDLTSIPENVFEGLNLESLELQGRPGGSGGLTAIPADLFDGLSDLLLLRLNDNAFTTLPADVFEGLTSLQELYLQNNDLTTLPTGLFTGLSSLTRLNLRGTTLDSLPAICMEAAVTCLTD